MDDFFQPKVVWARLMRISRNDVDAFPRFTYAPPGFFVVDSCCFFVGQQIDVLVKLLNSTYAAYYFLKNIAVLDNGGMQMRQQYIEAIPLPVLQEHEIEEDVDSAVYSAFSLTEDEIDFLSNFIQKRKEEIVSCDARH